MNFDEAGKKIVGDAQKIGRAVRDGTIAAQMVWASVGSPTPVPSPLQVDRVDPSSATVRVERSDTPERSFEELAHYRAAAEEDRTERDLALGTAQQRADKVEERPRPRSR